MNYVYILLCSDGTLYTGWTNDLEKRIKTHNDGKGAKYTKTRRPVTLVYYEVYQEKREALKVATYEDGKIKMIIEGEDKPVVISIYEFLKG